MLFAVYKVVFLAIYSTHIGTSDFTEVFYSLYNGLKLDASMAGYFLGINLITLLIFGFFESETAFNIQKRTNLILQFIFLCAYLIACSSELATYAEWQGKPSAKILIHLQHPSEIIAVATPFYSLLFFGSFIPLLSLSIFFYKKLIYDKWEL